MIAYRVGDLALGRPQVLAETLGDPGDGVGLVKLGAEVTLERGEL